MSVPRASRVAPWTRPGSVEAEPVAQEERQRRLVERVAGGVAVRLGVEDADPGAVGDHHGALGLVVLEADAAGLLQVEGAGLRGAVGVGLGEAALGAAQAGEVAVDRRHVHRLRGGGKGEGERGEGGEKGAAVHARHIDAPPADARRALTCAPARSGAVADLGAGGSGAVGAAVEGAVLLEAVADDPDPAGGAGGREGLDRAFEAVEGVRVARMVTSKACRSRFRRSRRQALSILPLLLRSDNGPAEPEFRPGGAEARGEGAPSR